MAFVEKYRFRYKRMTPNGPMYRQKTVMADGFQEALARLTSGQNLRPTRGDRVLSVTRIDAITNENLGTRRLDR